jgi:hypothetical protein
MHYLTCCSIWYCGGDCDSIPRCILLLLMGISFRSHFIVCLLPVHSMHSCPHSAICSLGLPHCHCGTFVLHSCSFTVVTYAVRCCWAFLLGVILTGASKRLFSAFCFLRKVHLFRPFCSLLVFRPGTGVYFELYLRCSTPALLFALLFSRYFLFTIFGESVSFGGGENSLRYILFICQWWVRTSCLFSLPVYFGNSAGGLFVGVDLVC